jgi:dCTP deaminase
MQLSPQTIRVLSIEPDPLITPFREAYRDPKSNLSGGLSCAGYDLHMDATLVPVEGFSRQPYRSFDRQHWVLPARTGCLANTVERFCIPQNMAMHYYNKSTLARKFLIACATLGEPGWHGHLTLELYNQTDTDMTLYPGQPIGQAVFIRMDHASAQPYKGKYQDQGAVPVSAR